VTELFEPPRLVWPTTAVRESFLAGERADCLAEGTSAEWLDPAYDDFDAFVSQRRGVHVRWGVPSTTFGTSPESTTWARSSSDID
jgi:hypothetical protein